MAISLPQGTVVWNVELVEEDPARMRIVLDVPCGAFVTQLLNELLDGSKPTMRRTKANPWACGEGDCEFVGKNQRSLNMHHGRMHA